MKNKKIKAGVVAAVGSAIIVSGGNAQAQTTQKRGVEDSIKLENRLKELAALPPREERMIAMCYAMAYTDAKGEFKCPHCGKETNSKWNTQITYNLSRVREVFDKIKAEGYDVALDETEYCPKCSKGKKIEYPAPVFKIRFSERSNYYAIKTGAVSDYVCLLAFLRDERLYKDQYKDEKYLPEEIQRIQKMTGLGKDLKIK